MYKNYFCLHKKSSASKDPGLEEIFAPDGIPGGDIISYIKLTITPVLGEVMRAPIQLQWLFSCTILANPEVEPHATYTYQSKLVPSDSINSNKCEGSTSRP